MGGADGLGLPALVESLQLGLQLDEGTAIEQVPQLLGAHQLGQHAAVEGERLGPPLGQRRVALVHELGHVGEGQAAGER